MFLFDGLDEIRDPALRIDFARTLITFLDQCNCEYRCILSMRKHVFVDDIATTLEQAGFEVFETATLSEEQRLEIIRNYGPPEFVSEILDAIRRNYRLARMSDNVLLLSLFAECYSLGGEYPNTRARILDADVKRRICLIPNDPGRRDEAQDFLAELAGTMRSFLTRAI